MDNGFTKVTVTIPTASVERARAVVAAGGAKSVSALVSDALQARLAREASLSRLDVLMGGEPIPEEALAWAAKALGVGEVLTAGAQARDTIAS
jgi:Arc/MetJ-type ribon-helix-helix transcriptional regulator